MPELGTVATAAMTNVETLAGLPELAGYQTLPGDVVALPRQDIGSQSGFYKIPLDATSTTGNWTRTGTLLETQEQFDTAFGKEFVVREGDHARWRFQFSTLPPVNIGTDEIVFDITSYGGEIDVEEGGGLQRVSNRLLRLPDQAQIPQDRRITIPGSRLGVSRKGLLFLLESTVDRETHIEGLEIFRSTGSTIGVRPGSVYIPGIDDIVEVREPITVDLAPATNSELAYVYITVDLTGAPILASYPQSNPEGVPDEPYFGNARTRIGSEMMRYVGTGKVNTTGSAALDARGQQGGRYHIVRFQDATTTFFRVVSASATQTLTPINIGPSGAIKVVPPSVRGIWARVAQLGTSNTMFFTPDDRADDTSQNSPVLVSQGQDSERWLPIEWATQIFTYRNASAGGNLFVDVLGYMEAR